MAVDWIPGVLGGLAGAIAFFGVRRVTDRRGAAGDRGRLSHGQRDIVTLSAAGIAALATYTTLTTATGMPNAAAILLTVAVGLATAVAAETIQRRVP